MDRNPSQDMKNASKHLKMRLISQQEKATWNVSKTRLDTCPIGRAATFDNGCAHGTSPMGGFGHVCVIVKGW